MSLDEEASKTFLEHANRIWFNPELERLRQIESAGEDYPPEKMQVILFPHKVNSVLFDDNVIPIEKLQANSKYGECGHVTFKKDVKGN